jgi:hypothetical protein
MRDWQSLMSIGQIIRRAWPSILCRTMMSWNVQHFPPPPWPTRVTQRRQSTKPQYSECCSVLLLGRFWTMKQRRKKNTTTVEAVAMANILCQAQVLGQWQPRPWFNCFDLPTDPEEGFLNSEAALLRTWFAMMVKVAYFDAHLMDTQGMSAAHIPAKIWYCSR